MGQLKTRRVNFSKDTGEASYVYGYKNIEFIGEAKCHEEDMDFCSNKVGLLLAETRAYIKFLKYRRRELIDKLRTVKGLAKDMQTSKDFDPSSKYAQKLFNTIERTSFELEEVKAALENIPKMVEKQIGDRDILYKKIREKRGQEESAN